MTDFFASESFSRNLRITWLFPATVAKSEFGMATVTSRESWNQKQDSGSTLNSDSWQVFYSQAEVDIIEWSLIYNNCQMLLVQKIG